MTKRKTNKNLVIGLLIVLMLLLAVGYAAFSDILTISGTVNAKGIFDLEFQNAAIVKSAGVRLAGENSTSAEISSDKDILIINVADLAYPGAGVEFAVDIVNVGTIPAKVQAVIPTQITENDVIKIKGLEVITTDHPVIAAGEKCNIHFTVEWPQDSIAQLVEEEIVRFNLVAQYVQATDKIFDGKPSHDGNESPIVSEKTLAQKVTAADYGKAINYSVEVNGKIYSDWKVLYNDGINVDIIMSDFLPQEGIPQGALDAGLEKVTEEGRTTYNVNSTVGEAELLSGLTTGWEEMAGGIDGAIAVGAVTIEKLIDSFNAKYNYNYGNPSIDTLYVTHNAEYKGCTGYWLAPPSGSSDMHIMYYNGGDGRPDHAMTIFGIRPVVTLPSNTMGIVGDTVTIKFDY